MIGPNPTRNVAHGSAFWLPICNEANPKLHVYVTVNKKNNNIIQTQTKFMPSFSSWAVPH